MTPIGAAEVPTGPGCPSLYLMLLCYLVQLYLKKSGYMAIVCHHCGVFFEFLSFSQLMRHSEVYNISMVTSSDKSHPNCTFKEVGLRNWGFRLHTSARTEFFWRFSEHRPPYIWRGSSIEKVDFPWIAGLVNTQKNMENHH